LEVLIGTGGWAYFRIPSKSSLEAYSEHFTFVEANSTFYNHPDPTMIQRWRRTVPQDFTFTVRCHQDLTHKIGLKPVDEAYAVFGHMIATCRILDAPFLHLLTPPSYVFDQPTIDQARAFLSTVNLKGIRLAWEVRGPFTSELAGLMQHFDMVHAVDLSRETSRYASDVIYTRLFGPGTHNVYQFTDDELVTIDKKIQKSKAERAFVTFHGLRMANDALRFKNYRETGAFIPVTAYTGLDSVQAVLLEDARFPSTKAELLAHQGWKVVDIAADTRVHLSELLSKLPEKTYHDVQHVIQEMRAFL
jgi:uncharacterized protein YecE (DUF72 family)